MCRRFQQQLVNGQIQSVTEFETDLQQYSDALKAESLMQVDTVAFQDVNSTDQSHVCRFVRLPQSMPA